MLGSLRNSFKKNIIIRKLVGYHLASSGIFDSFLKKYHLADNWKIRIQDVVSCPDNSHIPRIANAGKVKNGKQLMHNGLKINLGSYYGPEYVQLLQANRGVHEPQEEKVFAAILPTIKDGGTMIEMGAFWSFYSMWFNKQVKDAKNYMIEPDEFNLGQGKRNFRLNKLNGNFIQAFIGKSFINDFVPTICIDDFVNENDIKFIDILHSDIQGFEYDMLLGAERSINLGKIGYVFISTHSQEIHIKCKGFLIEKGLKLISEADLNNTYSEDGLLVAVDERNYPFTLIPVAQKAREAF